MKARKNVKKMRENDIAKLTNSQLYNKIVRPAQNKLYTAYRAQTSLRSGERTPPRLEVARVDRALKIAEKEKENALEKYQNIIKRRSKPSTPTPIPTIVKAMTKNEAGQMWRQIDRNQEAAYARENLRRKIEENVAKTAMNRLRKQNEESKKAVARSRWRKAVSNTIAMRKYYKDKYERNLETMTRAFGALSLKNARRRQAAPTKARNVVVLQQKGRSR